MRLRSVVRMSTLATLVAASPVLAGPPWISIEYPANPFDQATKGALLTLHTYHHGVPLDAVVTARAEGMVDGVRRSIPLTVRATGRPGVYAISGDLPDGAGWVVTSTMVDPTTSARASAMLALDGKREAVGMAVPLRRRGSLTVPREATDSDIAALLRGAEAAAATKHAQGPGTGTAVFLAGLGLLVCTPLWRRRRRPGRAD